jgi:hypothetical protein
MKIITWNCNMPFRKKAELILLLLNFHLLNLNHGYKYFWSR